MIDCFILHSSNGFHFFTLACTAQSLKKGKIYEAQLEKIFQQQIYYLNSKQFFSLTNAAQNLDFTCEFNIIK